MLSNLINMTSKSGRPNSYPLDSKWFSLDGITSRHVIEKVGDRIKYKDQKFVPGGKVSECSASAFASWVSRSRASQNPKTIDDAIRKAIDRAKKAFDHLLDVVAR